MQQDKYDKIIAEINQNSPIQLQKRYQNSYMTVHEMGDLLGLKKTERYWLIHKNYFPTQILDGKIYIKKSEFEAWYRNQAKYHKVTGEIPGEELKKTSYSAEDLAVLLDVSPTTVWDIVHKNGLETITYYFQQRIVRESFEKWYSGQTRYRIQKDRKKDLGLEYSSLSMPEMAKLLGIKREQVYQILGSATYGHYFEYIYVADRKRITRESFDRFLAGQKKYNLVKKTYHSGIDKERNRKLAVYRQKIFEKGGETANIGDDVYYTRQEAAFIAEVSMKTIDTWSEEGRFDIFHAGRIVRIGRKSFDEWLKLKKGEE